MTGILAAIVVLVGVVAGADLLLSFAIIRRLRLLEERRPSAGGGLSPAVGHRVGDFRVSLLTGGHFTRSDLADSRAIVIFVSPSCAPCQAAIEELRTLPVPLPSPLYVLVADADGDGAAAALIADLPHGARVGAIGATDTTAEAFRVDGFPTALAIEDGVVRANELRVSMLLDLARR